MRGVTVVSVLGMAALLGACGQTMEQRAATGGLGGAAAGAAVGGPVGAVVGSGAGAATGAVLDEDVGDKVAEAMPGGEQDGQAERRVEAGQPPAVDLSTQEVRQAQQVLRQRGYYLGAIDGIVGPRTREAVAQYQRREGLPQTAQLDERTVEALMQEQAAVPAERQTPTGATVPPR